MNVIDVARSHAGRNSSALLCLADAEALEARGLCGYARERALRSLQYSLGILHPIYIELTRGS